MTTIDHAAIAADLIANGASAARAMSEVVSKLTATEANEVRRLVGEQTASVWALAQVHATLALVEQQRIANVLAIAQFEHNAEGSTRIFTDAQGSAKWRAEAAEALGLS